MPDSMSGVLLSPTLARCLIRIETEMGPGFRVEAEAAIQAEVQAARQQVWKDEAEYFAAWGDVNLRADDLSRRMRLKLASVDALGSAPAPTQEAQR